MSDAPESNREQPMHEAGAVEDRMPADPVAVGPGEPVSAEAPVTAPTDGGADAPVAAPALGGADLSLLALVDRLTVILQRSDLDELEVAAGGTTIVLRAPSAVERPAAAPGQGDGVSLAAAIQPAGGASGPSHAASAPAPAVRPAVRAPLTGVYYGAPSPGATPYVAVGDHVAVGQIIGLIEAMKLFNEIKSDLAGRVVRICADSGALVKAKQPLIEVEPA